MIKNNYIENGHYRVNSRISARDRINTKKLIYDVDIFKSIVDEFSNYIRGDNNYIIGIDFIGMKVASLLAAKTHNFFSYIISDQYKEFYGIHDKNMNIDNTKNIILLTDVIVTGDRVLSIIERLKKDEDVNDDNIKKILTIFKRDGISDKGISTIENKIIYLNNEIDIQACSKEKCIYKVDGKNHCELVLL